MSGGHKLPFRPPNVALESDVPVVALKMESGAMFDTNHSFLSRIYDTQTVPFRIVLGVSPIPLLNRLESRELIEYAHAMKLLRAIFVQLSPLSTLFGGRVVKMA